MTRGMNRLLRLLYIIACELKAVRVNTERTWTLPGQLADRAWERIEDADIP